MIDRGACHVYGMLGCRLKKRTRTEPTRMDMIMGSTVPRRTSCTFGSAMTRSIPMQFCPAAWNVPRSKIEATLAISAMVLASSRTMAGSLPPSSTVKAVSDFEADAATL